MLLQLNAAIVRGLTCCKIVARHWALRKIWSIKFPLGGEVNHIQPVAYHVRHKVAPFRYKEAVDGLHFYKSQPFEIIWKPFIFLGLDSETN